jgi:folate-binding protein YgfZ
MRFHFVIRTGDDIILPRMNRLMLHEFHHSLGAQFAELNGTEIVNDYGDWLSEHAALREGAGVIDLSFRSRICLVGADRLRFLHGQVTNDVKRLQVGEGCYAAITTAKGKMESDLNILVLAEELLLDFEPGLTEKISARLEKFIVADDVQIVDAAPHYGLLSVQGPKAESTIHSLGLFSIIPTKPFDSVKISDAMLGEIYMVNHACLDGTYGRADSPLAAGGAHGVTRPTNYGFDLFVPNNSVGAVMDKLIAAKQIDGRVVGWRAFETARIEAGIPRYGADMDETNIPLECGIESRAIVYNKGCYVGQEVINRIHSVGHVNRELRGLRVANDLKTLPQKHDKLYYAGKEVGYVTSVVKSPTFGNIALGYVRREANQIGNELMLRTAAGESAVKIVELPFVS